MSICQGWYNWNLRSLLRVANFAWVCLGLVDGVMERQHVHKVWLRTDRLSTKCHVCCRRWLEISLFGPDFGSKTAFLCTFGQKGDFLFSVSNSWCVHPRLRCKSLSSSATRLSGWDISYLVAHSVSDGFDLIWFDVMLPFPDVEIGREKAEKGSWYPSEVWIFKLTGRLTFTSFLFIIMGISQFD